MHYTDALNIVRRVRTPQPIADETSLQLSFVSPIVSTMVAAGALREECFHRIAFSPICEEYAIKTGLAEALRGEYPHGNVDCAHGSTYSPLTKLAHDGEVEHCNAIISNLLYAALAGPENADFINAIAQVVGELHGNVPAHADAAGFSAAQVYCDERGCRLEFAISDCGRGMLRNVRRVEPDVSTHAAAIEWCLKRGNTTARQPDPLAQWLPSDSIVSPYPNTVPTTTTPNNHIGRGLWCLTELIHHVNGSLWIYTGNAEFAIDSGVRMPTRSTDLLWDGLAIEMEIDVDKAQSLNDSQLSETLADVARRLGL